MFAGGILVAQQGDYLRGLSYYKQKQYAKAIEEFEKIVSETPDYESGYRVLGDAYLRLKDYDGAIRSFQNALRLKDDAFVSYYGLAVAYYNVGRLEEVVSTLEQAQQYSRSPGQQYQLHSTRGSAHYGRGDFQQAVEDLEKAVSIQRNVPLDILRLGIAHYQLGNFQRARKHLTQAQNLGSDAGKIGSHLARVDYREGMQAFEERDYKRAVALLGGFIRVFPEDGTANFNLGLAQLFSGDLGEAVDRFLESARLMPTHWESYDRLGYAYEKRKDYPRALLNYRRAQELQPSSTLRESVERVEERIRRAEVR